ncbi:amino acid transporter [Wallemia mellicola]|nr:amino acid transporter [Wallemia mellicola]
MSIESVSSFDRKTVEEVIPDVRNTGDPQSNEDTGSDVLAERQLGVPSAVFLIINKIIGAGIFSTPGTVLKKSGSVGLALILWLVGGIISACGSIVLLELGTGVPVSGGVKNYLERFIPSRRLAGTCLYVFYCIILQVSAGNCITFSNYLLLAAQTEVTTWKLRGVGIAGISFAILLFAFFPKIAMKINNLLGVVKVFMLLFVIATGFAALGGAIKVDKPDNFNTSTLFDGTLNNASNISSALLSAIYSYQGYDNANAVLSEVKNPVRTLKIALPLAMSMVTILNILANVAYFSGVSLDQFHNSSVTVAGSLFSNVFGENAGTRALPALVSLSALGHLIGISKTIPVIIQELSKEGALLFNNIFTTSKPYGTPIAALALHLIVTIIFVVAPPANEAFDFITSLSSYPTTLMFFLCSLGILKLRYYDEDWDPPFKSPLIIIVSFIIASLFLLIAPFLPPEHNSSKIPYYLSSVVALAIAFLGIPYYLVRFILLPKMFKYELVPEVRHLPDGSRVTRYQKVSTN